MKKIIVLLVLMSASMATQASQTQVCKIERQSISSDLANCNKGDVLQYWGFAGKSNLIMRTACDFAQTIDRVIVRNSHSNDTATLHCIYIGYQRTERK